MGDLFRDNDRSLHFIEILHDKGDNIATSDGNEGGEGLRKMNVEALDAVVGEGNKGSNDNK